jgi:hypothetical protein
MDKSERKFTGNDNGKNDELLQKTPIQESRHIPNNSVDCAMNKMIIPTNIPSTVEKNVCIELNVVRWDM